MKGITIRGVLYLLKIEPEDDTKQEWEEKNSFYGRCKRRYLDPLLKRYSSKMSFVNKNATNVSINNMNSFGQEDFNDINKTNNYNDNSKSQENNKNKLSIHNIFKRIKIGHDNNNSNVEINVSNENNFKNLNIEEALEKTEKIVETYIEDQNTIREISVKLIKMLDENKLLSENNPESDIEDDSLSSMKKRTSH